MSDRYRAEDRTAFIWTPLLAVAYSLAAFAVYCWACMATANGEPPACWQKGQDGQHVYVGGECQ